MEVVVVVSEAGEGERKGKARIFRVAIYGAGCETI